MAKMIPAALSPAVKSPAERKIFEWYPIKLKLTGKYAMLAKERIYGKNQIVTLQLRIPH